MPILSLYRLVWYQWESKTQINSPMFSQGESAQNLRVVQFFFLILKVDDKPFKFLILRTITLFQTTSSFILVYAS